MKLAALTVVTLATTAHADTPTEGDAVKQRINSAFEAIKKKQTAKALAVLDDLVTVEALQFKNAKCARAFGGDERIFVTGAARATLVSCLAGETWFTAKLPYRLELDDGAWRGRVRLAGDTELSDLVLRTKPDGSVVIRGLHAPLGVEGGEFPSPPPPEPAGGGVVYLVPAMSPPIPPPPAPNVPPTELEKYRRAGDKAVVPDKDTQLEIRKSGKDKVVASLKLCIDLEGKVAEARLLKSSGFPAYDRTLETSMKTWAYYPYMVGARVAPACTAVTFIYAQK